MLGKSIAVAHGLNIASWVCIGFTFLTLTSLGKPAFVGLCIAMPLSALSLKVYNAAALEAQQTKLGGS